MVEAQQVRTDPGHNVDTDDGEEKQIVRSYGGRGAVDAERLGRFGVTAHVEAEFGEEGVHASARQDGVVFGVLVIELR